VNAKPHTRLDLPAGRRYLQNEMLIAALRMPENVRRVISQIDMAPGRGGVSQHEKNAGLYFGVLCVRNFRELEIIRAGRVSCAAKYALWTNP
jgi:hypothetical protein